MFKTNDELAGSPLMTAPTAAGAVATGAGVASSLPTDAPLFAPTPPSSSAAAAAAFHGAPLFSPQFSAPSALQLGES